MNLDRYIRDYARTAENLPGVLQRWGDIAPALREHYADELALLLASRVEALDAATGGSVWTAFRLAWVDAQMIAMRREILAATGVDPMEFILLSATTDAGASDTAAPPAEPSLGYGRPALAA